MIIAIEDKEFGTNKIR